MNPRRLYRSHDRTLAGVAGGMAEYLDIDPTVMRILWVLAGLLSVGFAILAYILLAIVIPNAPWSAAPAGAPPTWGPTAQAPMPEWAQPSPAWAPPAAWTAPAAAPAQSWTGYQPTPTAGTGSAWTPAGAQPSAWGTSGMAYAGATFQPRPRGRGIGAAAAVGLVLIAIGGIALLNAVAPGWIVPAASGPMILIVIGAVFLIASVRRAPQDAVVASAGPTATPTPAPVPAAPDMNAFTTASAADGPEVSDEATSIGIPFAGASPENETPA